jgi:hypothetical protein
VHQGSDEIPALSSSHLNVFGVAPPLKEKSWKPFRKTNAWHGGKDALIIFGRGAEFVFIISFKQLPGWKPHHQVPPYVAAILRIY